MSTILEFYVEKEKRELINTINSAKYISEEQKEVMIEGLLGKGTGILGRVTDADKKKAAEVEKNKRERKSAYAAKERANKAEYDKKKREREAKKKFAASPAGKEKAKKDRAELEKHFAKQDDPHARHAGGMYQDH
jgi:pyruvate/2-oxoglutarate dehydrogenase complex dihydrolipoamide acyltransferase (E2) component